MAVTLWEQTGREEVFLFILPPPVLFNFLLEHMLF